MRNDLPTPRGKHLEGELRAAIRAVLHRHLDMNRYRVYLFGSGSTGTALRSSDIDLGIEGDERVSGRVMVRIREELERLRTLRRFDLIDLADMDESFRNTALKDAEQL